jgi:hypothetical protein
MKNPVLRFSFTSVTSTAENEEKENGSNGCT